MILHLADGCEVVLAQPFVADSSVVAFDIGILLRLARLNVADGNAVRFSSLQQRAADILRAIVDPDGKWPPAPFDDPVE